jgi:PAS domain S-box-containing protein
MNTLAYQDTEKETEKMESGAVCEDALFASEARYRRLFESAKDGILILDAGSGKIIDVNPFLVDLLGYPKEKFIDKELWEIGFFKDIAANKDKFTELQKEKYVRYDDLPLETTDGRKINVEFVSNVYWANKKRVIQCNIRDITERIQAERSLTESEKKFKSYIDFAPDGIFVTDEFGRYSDINDSACKMTGYSRDELLGMSVVDLLTEESIDDGLLQFHKLVEKGTLKTDLSYKQKDGTKKWWALDAVKISETRFLGFAKDITDRKKIQNELKFQSNLLNNVGQAVIATDLTGKVIYWNNAAEKLYGWTSEEAIGQNIINLTPSQSTIEQAKEIMSEVSGGNSWTGEFMVKGKNGNSFPAMVTNAPFFNSKEELAGIIGISSDITERKLVESELILAKEKAEESDRLKSAFLANMSHEVRTPLNSIIGFSELLGDPDFDEEQKNKFLKHIITNGNSLLSIISDIMDISKLESGEFKIHKSHINVKAFLSNVIDQFAIQVKGKELGFKLSLPINGELTTIYADSDRLKQVFNNLISNAIKFTKTGTIEIGYTLKSANPNVVNTVGMFSKPVELEFFVKDTGIGIPAEYHTKIFERFMQVENSYTRNFGGVGLGLPISKKLIELMGGKIWFGSETENQGESDGSKFYFTVPIYSEKNK